jgi:hypothetical protein
MSRWVCLFEMAGCALMAFLFGFSWRGKLDKDAIDTEAKRRREQ